MARSTQKTSTDRPNVTAAAPASASKRNRNGLPWKRYFTRPGVAPFDEVQWETREASITNEKGEVVFEQHEVEWELRTASITDARGNSIFEQKDVESPKDWSMTAINIVASKYLHGTLGTSQRESGVRQLIQRVAESIRDWGWQQGYFSTAEDRDTFHDELVHILVQQKAAFNSPVWFNVGCDRLEPLSDAQNWHWNMEKGQVEFSTTG